MDRQGWDLSKAQPHTDWLLLRHSWPTFAPVAAGGSMGQGTVGAAHGGQIPPEARKARRAAGAGAGTEVKTI